MLPPTTRRTTRHTCHTSRSTNCAALGVELHLHGLTGALGVPHDAGPTVGVHGADGGTDGFGHCEVLVWLGDAFDQAGLGGVEGGEVAVELAESFDVEHAVDEEVEFGDGFRGAVEGGEGGDGAAVVVDVPGREVVPRGERRAVAGGEVVGGDDAKRNAMGNSWR